nr:unnamed protein product [Callosobruchus analis]
MDENRIIKVCHLNVRSLIGHIVDFSDLIQSNRYDIVAISETWLNGNVDGPAVQINNYNFVRRDRNDGSRGGGVGIYIKNYIKYEILSQGDNTEDVWVSFKFNNDMYTVGCIYRPPKNSFEELLFNKLPLCDKLICLGDFNIDLLNSTHATDLFGNLLDSYNITILMDRHAPLRACNFTKPYKPWITSNIKCMLKLQEKALVKFKRTRSAVDWERYKQLKNHITFLIRSEKKAYLQHVTNRDNKFVWKTVSNLKIFRKDNSIIPQYMKNVADRCFGYSCH